MVRLPGPLHLGMRYLVFALVMALGAPLSAMVVRPLTFDQLVGESTAIVYGRVADVRGQWTDDRQGIDSLLSVESFEYFKGSLGETVTVRVPGGQVGTFVHVLPGAPRFNVGDIVVLFLKANGPAIPIVTGTTQGVFRVKADPRTGDRVVMPPAVHVAAISSRGDPARRPMPIEAFGSAIRGAGAAR